MPQAEKFAAVVNPGKVKIILIVEKDAGMGSFLDLAITQETPYQTILVTNASQALKVTQTIKPDLFLIDYHLPGINGIQLYDRLHAIKALEEVPAIIMSTDLPRLEHEIKKRSLTSLSQPIELDAFFNIIEKLINQPS